MFRVAESSAKLCLVVKYELFKIFCGGGWRGEGSAPLLPMLQVGRAEPVAGVGAPVPALVGGRGHALSHYMTSRGVLIGL